MDFKTAAARARRGLREELRLYLVAVSSLAVAFLCLGGALLATGNLDAMADRWGTQTRMSIYLRDGAQPDDIAQLQVVLENLPDVASVAHLTSEAARAQFLEDTDVGTTLGNLPAEAFPASIEVELASGTPVQRVDRIATRVGQFRAVEDVETYRAWFQQLQSLIATGRLIAGALAVLVGLCVLAVIGNTIRLAVARRRQEIEVMKLCGATDAFVRGPFVLEGTFQGFIAALLAVLVLAGGYLLLREQLDTTVAALTGLKVRFLSPWILAALVLGGALVGAVGSAMSLRRYLTV